MVKSFDAMTNTGINADLTCYATVDTSDMAWQSSPSASVWRKRLEHFGDNAEAGHVTSIVRYDADSAFPEHGHPDGEEILVLEGVFSDEHGDYPAGTFLLNPTGFRHAPRSKDGCVLFVKLCQYAGADRPQVTIDSNTAEWIRPMDGVEVLPLYRSDNYPESMVLVRIQPGAETPRHSHPGGEEIFVIEGGLEDEFGRYGRGTWIRYPDGSGHKTASPDGALLYVKSGHLSA